ncbi:cation diffusion facilitator family transporter [Rhizobium sp. TRM96647]|uniref:cation diffusion facilitator family transporter n=1 Tax=unclassified Rhizobium TaxID=2613769 RepID=UPI0021E8FB9F|nr:MULTISPECIES: cation diffusion facilitator family transporter [unclassified Rhizobium]MCV3738090.1 cation diffusion facilitator family transporter [Rhizobium sp. TRM96647]MCV3759777.1 cation diffusion facilitator family transporter [Rhizobium sp. TRM96650]
MGTNGNATVNRLALIGIPMAVFVLGLKMLAWWVTGSVALLSDALESIVNVVAAVIAWGAIRYASRPADADHPFGHHKAEYLSAVIEGVLIVVAAILIVQEAVPKLWAPTLMEQPALGLGINFVAGLINVVWATILIRAGRRHRSPALLADGHHIMSDVITSAGVLVGLLLVLATGYAILDPVIAILVAANILFQGWTIISSSVSGLMDHAIEGAEEAAIKQAIAENAQGSLGVHDLKTRRAGQAIFVEFHLVVPARMAVADAHEICDRLEAAIETVHHGAQIAIHVEPETEKAHGIRVKVERTRA